MSALPPPAFEYGGYDSDGRAQFVPVEARPCGDHLVVLDHHIDLRCDLPEGHERRLVFKHRAILDLSQGHFVQWCDGRCSDPCFHVRHEVIPFLQRVRRSQP